MGVSEGKVRVQEQVSKAQVFDRFDCGLERIVCWLEPTEPNHCRGFEEVCFDLSCNFGLDGFLFFVSFLLEIFSFASWKASIVTATILRFTLGRSAAQPVTPQ
jgi:hypothetical protein